jgi:hypothetical protein
MRSPFFILAVLAVSACDAPPIDWGDPVTVDGAAGDKLVVDTAGNTRFVSDSAPAPAINAAGECAASARAASGATPTRLHAVWWAVRADSSAVLYMAASSDSGKTWGPPIVVDTADVSSAGCRRPPPAIAAVGDDLHIAYSMRASEGTGVFFAHFLSSMVHAPVAVIYGDRLVPTAIAADGNRVAVAYEDPNGTPRRVGVALSSSQGHIFEQHTTASRDVDAATNPLVAIAGRRIAVSWSTRQANDSATARRIVRRGQMR